MGKTLRTIARVLFILVGIYSLLLNLYVMSNLSGLTGIVGSILCFPLAVVAVPFYLLVNGGYWLPVVIIYGGGIICAILESKGKALSQETKRPPPDRTSGAVNGFAVFFVLFLLVGFVLVLSDGLPSSSPAAFFSPTSTPWPTRLPLTFTPVPRPTPTPDCTPAFFVFPSNEGQTICVYGDLIHQQFIPYNATVRLYLSESPPFFFLCENCYYDVEPGDCLTTRGRVELTTDDQPFINLHRQDIQFCE